MVLGRDVEGRDGYRLLGKGTVLTKAQVALLESWKVAEVWIEEAGDAAAAEEVTEAEAPAAEEQGEAKSEEDEALEAAKARIEKSFAGARVNAWMEALCEAATERAMKPRFWRTER